MSVRSNKCRLKVPAKPNTQFKKLHVIIILLSVVFCHNVFAQRGKINTLKKILPSLYDSARIDCLNELSGIYLRSLPAKRPVTNPKVVDTAAYYTERAYREAVKINYTHGIAESLSYKGEIENIFDNFLAQEKFSREAVALYKKTANKKRLAETYWNLGQSLYAQSFFAEAIKNLDTAYEWYKKNGNASGRYWVLSTAIYMESGNYERAFEVARKGLEIAIQNKDDYFKGWLLFHIGSLYWNIEDYKTALEYHRLAFRNLTPKAMFDNYGVISLLNFARLFTRLHQYDSAQYYYSFVDTSNPRGRRFYLAHIGEYYFAQKQYDKALPNLSRALNYHKQLNDRNWIMQTLLDIAKTYLAIGNNDSAFVYANEGFSIARQTHARQFIKDACEILSSVYDRWHQADSAYFYYKQYTTIKDSVLNDQVKEKFAAYTFEQKIELLNKEKQIQQVQLQKQSLLRNILVGGIIVLLVLAAIVIRNIILKRKNEKQSLEHKLLLQQLESKIESQQALLNERLLISRELHDELGANLSSISIFSQAAIQKNESGNIAESKNILERIGETSREVMGELNDAVWLINPSNDNLQKIIQRINNYALPLCRTNNIHFEIKTASLENLDLSVEKRKAIYLIIKEAVNNSLKYAAAKNIIVQFKKNHEALHISIKDDGNGFIENNPSSGNGLNNMKQRIKDVHGKICLNSAQEKGTEIILQVPLTNIGDY